MSGLFLYQDEFFQSDGPETPQHFNCPTKNKKSHHLEKTSFCFVNFNGGLLLFYNGPELFFKSDYRFSVSRKKLFTTGVRNKIKRVLLLQGKGKMCVKCLAPDHITMSPARGPFLQGPKTFLHPESLSKISNLMIA